MSDLAKIRPMVEDDWGFIKYHWNRLTKISKDQIRKDENFRQAMDDRQRMLLTTGSEIRMACYPENEKALFGFACCKPDEDVVHFVYVKNSFRFHGLAKLMLDGVDLEHVKATHWTPSAESIKQKHPEHIEFCPDIIGANIDAKADKNKRSGIQGRAAIRREADL